MYINCTVKTCFKHTPERKYSLKVAVSRYEIQVVEIKPLNYSQLQRILMENRESRLVSFQYQ